MFPYTHTFGFTQEAEEANERLDADEQAGKHPVSVFGEVVFVVLPAHYLLFFIAFLSLLFIAIQ